MTRPAHDLAVLDSITTRAGRYAPTRFEASRVDGTAPFTTRRLRQLNALSLSEAVEEAQSLCLHKDKLVIREIGDDGTDRLHIYAIKQKAATWVRRGFETVREQPLYADPVCVIDATVIAATDRIAQHERDAA